MSSEQNAGVADTVLDMIWDEFFDQDVDDVLQKCMNDTPNPMVGLAMALRVASAGLGAAAALYHIAHRLPLGEKADLTTTLKLIDMLRAGMLRDGGQ